MQQEGVNPGLPDTKAHGPDRQAPLLYLHKAAMGTQVRQPLPQPCGNGGLGH
jgi:hypothetical protein